MKSIQVFFNDGRQLKLQDVTNKLTRISSPCSTCLSKQAWLSIFMRCAHQRRTVHHNNRSPYQQSTTKTYHYNNRALQKQTTTQTEYYNCLDNGIHAESLIGSLSKRLEAYDNLRKSVEAEAVRKKRDSLDECPTETTSLQRVMEANCKTTWFRKVQAGNLSHTLQKDFQI